MHPDHRAAVVPILPDALHHRGAQQGSMVQLHVAQLVDVDDGQKDAKRQHRNDQNHHVADAPHPLAWFVVFVIQGALHHTIPYMLCTCTSCMYHRDQVISEFEHTMDNMLWFAQLFIHIWTCFCFFITQHGQFIIKASGVKIPSFIPPLSCYIIHLLAASSTW